MELLKKVKGSNMFICVQHILDWSLMHKVYLVNISRKMCPQMSKKNYWWRHVSKSLNRRWCQLMFEDVGSQCWVTNVVSQRIPGQWAHNINVH